MINVVIKYVKRFVKQLRCEHSWQLRAKGWRRNKVITIEKCSKCGKDRQK